MRVKSLARNCCKKSKLRLYVQKPQRPAVCVFSQGEGKVIETAGAGVRVVLLALDCLFVQGS